MSSLDCMKVKPLIPLVMTLAGTLLVSSCLRKDATSDSAAPPTVAASTNAPTWYAAREDHEREIKIVRLYYATDRKRTGDTDPIKFYGSERTSQDMPLEYGVCHVTLPPEHQFARLE